MHPTSHNRRERGWRCSKHSAAAEGPDRPAVNPHCSRACALPPVPTPVQSVDLTHDEPVLLGMAHPGPHTQGTTATVPIVKGAQAAIHQPVSVRR